MCCKESNSVSFSSSFLVFFFNIYFSSNLFIYSILAAETCSFNLYSTRKNICFYFSWNNSWGDLKMNHVSMSTARNNYNKKNI